MAEQVKVALIPGDGIGPEVVSEARRLLAHVRTLGGPVVQTTTFDLSADRYLRTGETLPDAEFEQLRDGFDAILLGALGDPRVPDHAHARDIVLGLRTRLDLYINLRPIRLLHPAHGALKGDPAIDMVVFRENTEGLYTGIGGQFKRGTADEVAIEAELNTRKGVQRIIEAAFDFAATHGRRRVTLADKSNAMRHGHDLWQRVFAEVAAGYPGIEASHLYVDALVMEMVRDPSALDVIVTNNLFGDIITDLGAQLQGGMGLAASANLHPGRPGLFEPVHGSAPALVGTGSANPLAAHLSVAMMMRQVGFPTVADAIESAVATCLAEGHTTPELGGTLSTSEVTDHLLSSL